MTVYVLLYHDIWDLARRGPVDVSIDGIFTSRDAAVAFAAKPEAVRFTAAPLLDEAPDDLDDFEGDAFYTIEEHEVNA